MKIDPSLNASKPDYFSVINVYGQMTKKKHELGTLEDLLGLDKYEPK